MFTFFSSIFSFFQILIHCSNSKNSAMLSQTTMRKNHGGKYTREKSTKNMDLQQQQASKTEKTQRKKRCGKNMKKRCGKLSRTQKLRNASGKNAAEKTLRKTFKNSKTPQCSAENPRRNNPRRKILRGGNPLAEKPKPSAENPRRKTFGGKPSAENPRRKTFGGKPLAEKPKPSAENPRRKTFGGKPSAALGGQSSAVNPRRKTQQRNSGRNARCSAAA